MTRDFKINDKPFIANKAINTGRELLEIAGLKPVENYELLYRINEGGYTPIQLEEKINLDKVGVEGFKAKPYKTIIVNIDDKEYQVDEIFMTPLELLDVAKIDSDSHYLIEVRNDGDEITYRKDPEHKITISESSKFYSKEFKKIEYIVVNTDNKPWTKKTITYDEVVELAYGQVSNDPKVLYTITYTKGVPSKPSGTLVKGGEIKVKNKMIFNVTQANQS